MSSTVDIEKAPTFYSLPKEEQELIERTCDSGQHVYFIKADGLDIVKIGKAKEPRKRLKALQIGSPVHLMLLLVIPFGGFAIEKKLHQHFKSLNKHGEWFEYSTEVKQMVQEITELLKGEQWLSQLAQKI